MKFECIKFFKNPKNLFLLVLIFLSIFVSLANVHFDQINKQKKEYEHIKAVYNEIDPPQNYAGPKEDYKLLHHLDDARQNYLSVKDKEMYDLLFQVIYLLEEENSARVKERAEEQLSTQQERLKLQKKYVEMGGETWKNESNIDEKIAYNDWLIHNKLPIVNLAHGQQGFYFVYYLLNHWMQFLLIGIVGLFFFDFLAVEYEKKTYRLLFTQPISKGKFFFNKYLTSILLTFSAFFLLLLIGFSLASLIYGTGSLNYPISINTASGTNLIPLSQLLIQAISLQLLFLSFVLGCLMLLAHFLKKSLETLGIFFLIFLIPNIIYLFINNSIPYLNGVPIFFMNSIVRITETKNLLFPSFIGNLGVMILGNGLLWLSMYLSVRRKSE